MNAKTPNPDRHTPTRRALRKAAARAGCILTYHLDGTVTATTATDATTHPNPRAALAALTA